MPRLLAVLLTVVAASAMLLLPAPDASAAPAPTVSPSTVKPGGSFTVSGTGCWDPTYDPASGEEAQWMVIVSTAFGHGAFETTESPGGAWSVTVQVPATWHPGSGSVESFCRLSNDEIFHYPKLYVTVPPPAPLPAPPPPAATPRTTVPAVPRNTPPATSAAPAAPPTAAASTTAPRAIGSSTGPGPGCIDCARLVDGGPVRAGDELTLSYTGFQPGEEVTIVMRSTPVELGTFPADSDGVVTADVTIPDTAEAGSHTLTLSGPVTGEHVVRFRLARAEQQRVSGHPAAAESALPPLLWLGGTGLVLAAGGVALLLRQRRSRPEPATETPDQATATPIAEPIA